MTVTIQVRHITLVIYPATGDVHLLFLGGLKPISTNIDQLLKALHDKKSERQDESP